MSRAEGEQAALRLKERLGDEPWCVGVGVVESSGALELILYAHTEPTGVVPATWEGLPVRLRVLRALPEVIETSGREWRRVRGMNQ